MLKFLTIFIFPLLTLVAHSQTPYGMGNSSMENSIPSGVESFYRDGLKFLVDNQKEDGSWKGNTYSNFPGTVSLCLLALLAYGEDPNHGPYAKNITSAINYLLSCQDENGYIGMGKSQVATNMYNHGFTTLALAEAYGMVDNPKIGPALQKAVDLILTSQKQNPLNAWRYNPGSKNADTSVAGCMIVALFAARNAGIVVPDQALEKALKYMDSCRSKTNGAYGYTSAGNAKVTLTAVGLLCQSLAKNKDTEEYKLSLKYLKDNINYRDSTYPYYFLYYMSQALFQADEKLWNTWNKKNMRYLKTQQGSDGSISGKKEKPYSTAASMLSLALNYRFLPIYEK